MKISLLYKILLLISIWVLINNNAGYYTIPIAALFLGSVLYLLRDASDQHIWSLKFILYLLWLIKEIFYSAINVVKIIWNPYAPINPGFIKVKTNIDSVGKRVLYANSITLTPGTLTVELKDQEILIHNLDLSSSFTQDMENKIIEILK